MTLTCARSASQAMPPGLIALLTGIREANASEHTSAQIREEIIYFLLYDSSPMLAACAFLNILQPLYESRIP